MWREGEGDRGREGRDVGREGGEVEGRGRDGRTDGRTERDGATSSSQLLTINQPCSPRSRSALGLCWNSTEDGGISR